MVGQGAMSTQCAMCISHPIAPATDVEITIAECLLVFLEFYRGLRCHVVAELHDTVAPRSSL